MLSLATQDAAKALVSQFMLKDSPCYIGLKEGEPALNRVGERAD